MSICFCASGCALNSMADPGVFGWDCSCWCHEQEKAKRAARLAAKTPPGLSGTGQNQEG